MGHIFISYSHKDKAYVHKLQEALQKEGFEVWIDDRIDYGSHWPKVIQDQLDSCDAFLVVVSDNSYESEWVQNEVARAKRKGKPFFPLLLGGDAWLSVEATQYVDVKIGALPPEKFYQRLEGVTARNRQAAVSPPSMPSPIPASTNRRLDSKFKPFIGIIPVLAILIAVGSIYFAVKPSSSSPPTPADPLPLSPKFTPFLTITPIPTPTNPFAGLLSEIRGRKPFYEIGFDDWGTFWKANGDAKVENGLLIVYPEAGANSATARILDTDKFAVQFDFRFQKSEQSYGTCAFEAERGTYGKNGYQELKFSFSYEGQAFLVKEAFKPGVAVENLTGNTAASDYSKTNSVMIIVFGNQIAAFVNDWLTYSTLVESTAYPAYRLSANLMATCEFDNFKAWDLTELTP